MSRLTPLAMTHSEPASGGACPGLPSAVHAVADAADGFINFFALRARAAAAPDMRLEGIQHFGAVVGRIDFGVEPAAVTGQNNSRRETAASA